MVKKTVSELLKSAMECIICKGILNKPQFARCCQRIVGCEDCINDWFRRQNTCPHCAQPILDDNCLEVEGLDEVLDEVQDN